MAHDDVDRIYLRLDVMDRKLDYAAESLARLEERHQSLERRMVGNGQPGIVQRVGRLERYFWMAVGGITLLSGLLPVAIAKGWLRP